jgi:UDP-glucose 4-epimerase
MKSQIIITGGAGFIGHHLAKKLIEKNYYPIIIDDLFNADIGSINKLPPNKYTFIKSDINNSKIKNNLKKFNPKIIVHLAAIHYIPYCISHSEKVVKTNILGTKNILKLSTELKIEKFIFSSSAAVYRPKKTAHRENDAIGPIDIYGQTKIEAEKLINNFCKKKRISSSILRFFNVYGKDNMTPHLIPSIIMKLKKSNNIIIGNIDTYRDYIHVNDVVDIIIKIIKNKNGRKNSVYNIGTGKKHSGRDILLILEKLLKNKLSITVDEKFFRKNDRKFLTANINKIKMDYRWQPAILLKNGLKNLIKND